MSLSKPFGIESDALFSSSADLTGSQTGASLHVSAACSCCRRVPVWHEWSGGCHLAAAWKRAAPLQSGPGSIVR